MAGSTRSYSKILLITMALASLCHGRLQNCPSATLGQPYTISCVGETSSHEKFINWERDDMDGHKRTIASCDQNQHTPKCNRPETLNECHKPSREVHLYSVNTCIRSSSSSSSSNDSKNNTEDIYNNNGQESRNETDDAEGDTFFTSTLVLKLVTELDNGAIFKCKILDWKTNMVQRGGSCMLKVVKYTQYRRHHESHHGRHHERNNEETEEDLGEMAELGALGKAGPFSQASLPSRLGCSYLAIFMTVLNLLL